MSLLPLQQVFDGLAPYYHLPDLLSFRVADRLRRNVVRAALRPADRTVIDLMCGSGNNRKWLTGRQPLHYTGYDVSPAMIREARRRYGASAGVDFFERDLLREDCGAGAADLVLCSYGLKCIPPADYEAFVCLVDRAIGQQGRFCFLEFQYPSAPFPRRLAKAYLKWICRPLNGLVAGNSMATRALEARLQFPVDTERWCALFAAKGIAVALRRRFGGAVIELEGQRIAAQSCAAGTQAVAPDGVS
ncbi:class I SAM-dependent DNA methyltransferase [Flaviaesturariibacter amylovorans]|uniref:Methyltransferase domain-containing protein n=1 Tax=Flaviaesturariibacter amylovorans TaxID=1084520 RepID=A0ABP8G4F6_9BACT